MADNRKFISQINKFAKISKDTGSKEIRKGALFALSSVVKKSPVDEGVFRGNWNVGINGSDTSIDEFKIDDKGDVTISKGGAIIGKFKLGESIWISNNLPYANRLEFGYSDQAPSGMVRVTVKEVERWFKSRKGKV